LAYDLSKLRASNPARDRLFQDSSKGAKGLTA
jgi:hypothetical protein